MISDLANPDSAYIDIPKRTQIREEIKHDTSTGTYRCTTGSIPISSTYLVRVFHQVCPTHAFTMVLCSSDEFD